MVINCLFKSETGADSSLDAHDENTRIIWFWLHQSHRLTDGYIAIPVDGKPRVQVNWTVNGSEASIAERAEFNEQMWRSNASLADWDAVQLDELVAQLDIDLDGRAPIEAFAETVTQPIRQIERELNRPRLSIQWDIGARDRNTAIAMRNNVLSKAEAILNDAGLLINRDDENACLNTVAATLEVTQFDAAKTILWQNLSAEERGHNCRITDGT